MPAAPVATPTPAPAAPAAMPPIPLPPVSGVINVVPKPAEAAAPPKPGSAREGMFSRLREKAGEAPAAAPAEPVPRKSEGAPAAAKPAEAKPAEAKPAEAKVVEPTDAEIAEAAKAPVDPNAKTKVNPWKLVEQYKKAAAAKEKEVADLRKTGVDPEARKAETERYAKIEARAKELEEHIRFTDYSKSEEFQEKYQKPYEKAWSRAMGELKELTVSDPTTGEERAVVPQDVLRLVNMPLNQAREMAEELFGAAANDVMLHRKEIKQLFEAKSEALKEAKESGAERIKNMTAQQQQAFQKIQQEVVSSWEAANKEAVENPKVAHIFKVEDGDEEGRAALEKAYTMVDQAFAANPLDPKLTSEQRATAIRQQAAVRNRAAGFTMARLKIERLNSRVADLEKELAEYKGTTPNLEGREQQAAPAAEGSKGMDGMFGRLRARAK